jgi:hypothetical protein
MTSRLSLLLLPLTLVSCTATLDLDRFKKAAATVETPGGTVRFSDVRFSAKAMNSHINEYFEVRIVDKDNRVQAKAVYGGVTDVDFSLYLARVVGRQNPPYRIDFWADHNLSGLYDGIEGGINEKDHAWRRVLNEPLPEDVTLTGGRYQLDFVHDTAFVDIYTDLQGGKISGEDTLLPFKMKMVNAGAYDGKMVEVRVVDKAADRLVALHRQGRATDGYVAAVTGVLDEATYTVAVFVDANGDGRFSAGDPSWNVEHLSTRSGIDVELDLGAAPQSPITTGEP